MIPFARVLKYGNTLPKGPTIIDIKHSYTSDITTYVLRDNGELWGGGYNTNGALGLGNVTNAYRNTCVKLRDDVKKIAHYAGLVMVWTNDNKLLIAGNDDRISSASSSYIRSTWFDISNRFGGVDLSQIKEIGATVYNAYVLTNNGNLYSIGFFRALGAGMSSGGNYTNTPSLIGTNVVSMQVNLDSTTFQKADKTIWGFGNNGYGRRYSLDVPSPSSTTEAAYVISPVQMFTTFDTNNAMGWYSSTNNNMLVLQDGLQTVGCGSPNYGTLGTGYNTAGGVGYLSTDPSMLITLQTPVQKIVYAGGPNGMQRVYRGVDGYYYMIGYNPNGELGIGITKGTGNDYAITVWTKNEVLPVSNDSIVGFSYGYFVSYMYTEDTVYVCGDTRNSIAPATGTAVTTFTKINLPFY